jgi:uncharacterized membrane protein YkgB
MMNKLLTYAAGLQNIGVHIARWGIVLAFLWIGSLNALKYEPYGNVPLVSDKSVNFFKTGRAPEYKQVNNEGDYKPDNIAWHVTNDADTFSYIMGSLMILTGVMIALYPVLPAVSAAGSFLAFIVSSVALLSLITIPETRVATLGHTENEFPYLSTEGRFVVKSILILGASIATMAQAAKTHLKKETMNA